MRVCTHAHKECMCVCVCVCVYFADQLSLYHLQNCISKIENLDVLPHLTFLDLSHNSVQSLGTHLKDLSSLKVLDVSHNLIEVCDPGEIASKCGGVRRNGVLMCTLLADTQLPPRLQFLCLHNNPVQDKDPHLRHNIITYLAWLVSEGGYINLSLLLFSSAQFVCKRGGCKGTSVPRSGAACCYFVQAMSLPFYS